MTLNIPVRFAGTAEEARENRETHHWVEYSIDEPRECADCCARSYHAAAEYPCGTEPPRQIIT